MNEKIKPALTPEQWRDIARLNDDDLGSHAYAAVLLYGQPFGFTHEDVRLLRDEIGGVGFDRYDQVLELADRIAALLPPTP